jgi:hypothetical protein
VNEEVEMFYAYYVEKSSRLIYQVQFFDTFVMYRPATPGFESLIKRMELSEFLDEFDEFEGDPRLLDDFIDGEAQYLLTTK